MVVIGQFTNSEQQSLALKASASYLNGSVKPLSISRFGYSLNFKEQCSQILVVA